MAGRAHSGSAGLRRTLLHLAGVRLLLACALLGAATLVRLRGADGGLWTDPLFLLIGATFALTALYTATVDLAVRHRWLIDGQLAADVCLVSAAVLLTGGPSSMLATLYVMPVMAASLIQLRRGGLLVALLGTVLYGGVLAIQYNGWDLPAFPWPRPAALLPPLRHAIFVLLLNGVGLVVIALLTGYLAERIRSADERLERARGRIASLEAFNQIVIDSLTGGLATTDEDGTVLTFNRAAEQITGWPAAEAVGRPARDVLQLPDSLYAALPGLVESGHGRRVEYPFETRDGRRLDLGLTAAPLVAGRGRVGRLFTFQDVTEQRRREREAQSERRLAAIGQMAAGIAHEIRNPLASMTGAVQVLRRELALTDEQARLMDIVVRESERLDETIQNFLAYARPGPRVLQRVDLRRVVSDTATLVAHSPERHPEHRIEPVPPGPEVPVLGDEAQLRQVVWNLASNALRAMPRGGTLAMAAQPADEAGRAAIVVRDEGIGIAPEDLDRVFEPFRSGFPGGSGLGLAIVHRIVTDLGGTIELDSAAGSGTTVRVLIPAAPPAGAAAMPAALAS
jgi:two-component system sensor histidine kinase PilS (NtrC family)